VPWAEASACGRGQCLRQRPVPAAEARACGRGQGLRQRPGPAAENGRSARVMRIGQPPEYNRVRQGGLRPTCGQVVSALCGGTGLRQKVCVARQSFGRLIVIMDGPAADVKGYSEKVFRLGFRAKSGAESVGARAPPDFSFLCSRSQRDGHAERLIDSQAVVTRPARLGGPIGAKRLPNAPFQGVARDWPSPTVRRGKGRGPRRLWDRGSAGAALWHRAGTVWSPCLWSVGGQSGSRSWCP
jgi:hypothetical protein